MELKGGKASEVRFGCHSSVCVTCPCDISICPGERRSPSASPGGSPSPGQKPLFRLCPSEPRGTLCKPRHSSSGSGMLQPNYSSPRLFGCSQLISSAWWDTQHACPTQSACWELWNCPSSKDRPGDEFPSHRSWHVSMQKHNTAQQFLLLLLSA